MAKKKSSDIIKLRLAGTLSQEQIEAAVAAGDAASKTDLPVELLRVDYLPDATVLYYRASKAADAAIRKALRAAAPKARQQGRSVTKAALAKAP